MEAVNSKISETKSAMQKAIEFVEVEMTRIRAGKASPSMLDGITVDYYGTPTPIDQVANVSNQDNRTLLIQPWEKNMLTPIEKGIIGANIGVTPQSDGIIIRISMPPVTEERRLELVKKAREVGENGRVAIRNLRREANDHIKKLQKEDTITEDMSANAEIDIQSMTDEHIRNLDSHLEAKEKEIMTV